MPKIAHVKIDEVPFHHGIAHMAYNKEEHDFLVVVRPLFSLYCRAGNTKSHGQI